MTSIGILNTIKLTLSIIFSILCGVICLIHGGLFNLLIGGVLLIGDIVTIFSALNLEHLNNTIGVYTHETFDKSMTVMNHIKL